jgi:dynactin 1
MSWSEFTPDRKVQLNDGRNGIIRYAGHTQFAPGLWIGVELDDATGKNDGSVGGHRYFDCPMGYGMFVRPTALKLRAGPPAVFMPQFMPQPAKKTTTRSSSMLSTTSSRASTPADPGLTKRMSLNNPSPTPGQKPGRKPSNPSPTPGQTALPKPSGIKVSPGFRFVVILSRSCHQTRRERRVWSLDRVLVAQSVA